MVIFFQFFYRPTRQFAGKEKAFGIESVHGRSDLITFRSMWDAAVAYEFSILQILAFQTAYFTPHDFINKVYRFSQKIDFKNMDHKVFMGAHFHTQNYLSLVPNCTSHSMISIAIAMLWVSSQLCAKRFCGKWWCCPCPDHEFCQRLKAELEKMSMNNGDDEIKNLTHVSDEMILKICEEYYDVIVFSPTKTNVLLISNDRRRRQLQGNSSNEPPAQR